jgi:hypothetical protein
MWETQVMQLLQSLRFPNMNGRSRDIDKPVAGTGQWLFSNDSYNDWFNGKDPQQCQGFLSLKGKPGAGKSVLIKEAIRRAALIPSNEETSYLILSFFFNGKGDDALEHSAEGMYRALLYQILEQSSFHLQRLGATLNSFQKLGSRGSALSTDCGEYEAKHNLEMLLTEKSNMRIRIFIDALDECDDADRRDVAYFWREVTNKAFELQVDLCVCISQRTFPCTVTDKSLDIVVDNFNRDDIERYVVKKFSLGFAKAEPRWHLLKDKIMEKSSGVFLWVALVVEEILQTWDDEACNVQELVDRLDKIPSELQATFSRSLLTMTKERRHLAKHLFEWAILPTKPRRLHEWHHILAFIREPAPKSLAEWRQSRYFTETDDQLERQIRTISRGLIEVVGWTERPQDPVNDTFSVIAGAGSLDMEHGDTRIVQVIHESVREFFLHGPGFSTLDPEADPAKILGLGHLSIMHTCLDYLMIKELDPLVLARLGLAATEGIRIKKTATTVKPLVPLCTSPDNYDNPAGLTALQLALRNSLPFKPLSSKALAELPAVESPLPQSSMAQILKWRKDCLALSNSVSSTPSAKQTGASFESCGAAGTESVSTQILEGNTTLLSYVLFQLFPHAMAAQKGGACPKSIIERFVNEGIWGRWVSLREDIDHDITLIRYCLDYGLHTWIEYLINTRFFAKDKVLCKAEIIEQAVARALRENSYGNREELDGEARNRRWEEGSVQSFSSASCHVAISRRPSCEYTSCDVTPESAAS